MLTIKRDREKFVVHCSLDNNQLLVGDLLSLLLEIYRICDNP